MKMALEWSGQLDEAIITVSRPRWFRKPKTTAYRGSGTVWHEVNGNGRAATHTEIDLCDFWEWCRNNKRLAEAAKARDVGYSMAVHGPNLFRI